MSSKSSFAHRGRHGRVAIVGGVRTPFVKSGTAFHELRAFDLGVRVVSELLARLELDAAAVDRVIFGQVIPSVEAPNIAREVVLGTGMRRETDAYSVSRACATSTQAIVDGAMAILGGDVDVVVCGGAESLSKPPITYSDRFIAALMEANAAKKPIDKARAFMRLTPADLLPKPPALEEQATGLSMGASAEKMAKDNAVSRADQDAFALRSHQRAATAWASGLLEDEVMSVHVPPSFDACVRRDGFVRADTSLEKLAALKPVFDNRHGSVTAGNASPLTDGAAAVVLMSEERARALGYSPLAYVRAWAFVGVDPAWQLLIGPAFAVPKALDRAGLTLADVDLVDVHEAFAAQVLANLRALASTQFAEKHLGRAHAVGDVPDEKLNVYGGSIALGHPFGATGARQALTMARELDRRGGGTALVTQCAAGGLGAALILERGAP